LCPRNTVFEQCRERRWGHTILVGPNELGWGFISDSSLSGRYKAAVQKYPHQLAFYKDLEQHCELVQTWNPYELNGTGPEIKIYRIPRTLP
jgi:hypothetical protein